METEKPIKVKKSKLKKEDNFKLLNILEFSTFDNNLSNDLFNIKLKKKSSKKHKSKKNKDKNIIPIDNSNNIKNNFDKPENVFDSDDSEYLEKKLVKNNLITERKNLILASNDENKQIANTDKIVNKSTSQYINTVNPLIKNEVIWYSEDLDSIELENKFKNKFTEQKNVKAQEYKSDNYEIYSMGDEIEQYFTNGQQLTLCKKYILECKKIDSNIFLCDTCCDPNYSPHTLSNNFGQTYLNDIFFVLEGKKYIPEIVEIYLNENILLKRIYSDITKNINKLNMNEEYNIGSKPFELLANTKISIKIIDSKEIDGVYFNTENKSKDNKNKLLCSTHELLYEGIESEIKIDTKYGYYTSIYIICENIINVIKSISLINSNISIFNNIPLEVLEPMTNSLTYTLKFDNNIISGLKVDSNNCIDIKLDKINPDKKIKIYGNKLSIIHKQQIIKK